MCVHFHCETIRSSFVLYSREKKTLKKQTVLFYNPKKKYTFKFIYWFIYYIYSRSSIIISMLTFLSIDSYWKTSFRILWYISLNNNKQIIYLHIISYIISSTYIFNSKTKIIHQIHSYHMESNYFFNKYNYIL